MLLRFSLSPTAAVIGCLGIASAYVGSLYIYSWKPAMPRNHPETIKQRIVSVAVVSAVAPVLVYSLSSLDWDGKGAPLLEWLGLRTEGLVSAMVKPLALTATLFLGPLVKKTVDGDLPPTSTDIRLAFHDLVCWRNYVVGPVTEECVFRACLMPLLVPALGNTKAILVNPLFFGVAHLHHLHDLVVVQRYPLAQVLPSVVLQFGFTSVFGMYSAWLFVRTGHVAAPLVCHIFCNLMGFPDFGDIPDHPRKKLLMASFVAGLAGFIVLANPLTAGWSSVYQTFP